MKRALRRRQLYLTKQRVRRWWWVVWWAKRYPAIYGAGKRAARNIGMLAATPSRCQRSRSNLRKWEGPTLQELRGPGVEDWDDYLASVLDEDAHGG